MRSTAFGTLASLMAVLAVSNVHTARAQDSPENSVASAVTTPAVQLAGHPFSAIKYSRTIRVLPDGKQQFIRNIRYPIRIARDANGRLMMQMIDSDDLNPECDRPDRLIPPPCPAWGVFVIDPESNTVMHWPEGELAAHIAVSFPLTQARLEQAVAVTTQLPDLSPPFSAEDGDIVTTDLGDKKLEGILAHGVRTVLYRKKGDSLEGARLIRIHEVWTAPDMNLIVRVIDGEPGGVETVWGLEKISLQPDSFLFQPPAGYAMQHATTDRWTVHDFEYLESWFSKN